MHARQRVVSTLMLVGAMVVSLTTAAVADGYSSALGDDQGSHLGAGVTPVIPGLDWVAELPATEFNGSHGAAGVQGYGRPTIVTDNGLVVIAVDDTTAANSAGETNDTLIAIDTADGSKAWQVDDIDNDCPVVSGPDGRVWGVRKNAAAPDRELVSIDPTDGSVTSEFTRVTNTATNPHLVLCGETPLRISQDGDHLIMWQDETIKSVDEFIRILDISGGAVTQTAIIDLESTDTPGVFGGWSPHDFRVSPTRNSIYLMEQLAGADPSCCGQDDVHMLHAVDLDSLPAESAITDAGIADRSVELAVSDLWAGGILVDGDTIYVSGEEDLGGRVPADGDDVNSRLFKVMDDGSTLTVEDTAVGRPLSTRAPNEHNWHYVRLSAGDGTTLVGLPRGSQGVPSGIDADTLDKVWTIDRYNCLSQTLAADADGNTLFHDFCDGQVISVTPDGRVRWVFATDDDAGTGGVDEGKHEFIDGSGTFDMGTLESFSIDAVTADGKVIVSAETSGSASFSGVSLFAIDLGTATTRAAGSSRLETATEISRATYPGGADVVVIAKAGDYPDALAGAPLSIHEGGPLLLSSSTELSGVTEAEINRLGATRAILLGGDAALSPAVKARLETLGLTVERVAGANRYDTAALVSDRIGATEAVVVEGANANPSRGWPDAVAASSWAASTGRAILLVTATRVPTETAAALDGMANVAVVGGEGAVPAAIYNEVDDRAGTVERIAGTSRYATSALVAERSVADGNSLDVVWLATGTGFADALTAGPAAALTDGVLLLIHGSTPGAGAETYEFLSDNAADIGSVFLVGGVGAISEDVADAVDAALGR